VTTIILAGLLFLFFLGVGLGILRAIVQTWVDHRVRLVLLENLEQHPDSREAAQKMLADLDHISRRKRHDYTLTGILLALIGLGCATYGRFVGLGRLAVGMHVGGMVCVALGVLLALLGLLIYYLAGHAKDED
jgi:hypothetical protein